MNDKQVQNLNWIKNSKKALMNIIFFAVLFLNFVLANSKSLNSLDLTRTIKNNTRNELYPKAKILSCVILIIYTASSFIYYFLSKKENMYKRKKILYWLANSLIITLMVFLSVEYYVIYHLGY